MLRRPVFRRKRHSPETRPRIGKLQSHFRFAGTHRPQERYMAFLFFLSQIVLHLHFAAAGDPRQHHHQRAMRINRQRRGLFLELLALGVIPVNSYGNLHQNSLAVAAWPGMSWSIWGLAHRSSSLRLYRAGPESRGACRQRVCKKATRRKGSIALGTLLRGNEAYDRHWRLHRALIPGAVNPGHQSRINLAARLARNSVCHNQDKFAGDARFSAPDPAAALPTVRSSRTSAESRTAPGTSSSEIPSTGKSTRCRSPRWDTASASRNIRLRERCARTPARSPAAGSCPSGQTLHTPHA